MRGREGMARLVRKGKEERRKGMQERKRESCIQFFQGKERLVFTALYSGDLQVGRPPIVSGQIGKERKVYLHSGDSRMIWGMERKRNSLSVSR